jgi:hypothetical protein
MKGRTRSGLLASPSQRPRTGASVSFPDLIAPFRSEANDYQLRANIRVGGGSAVITTGVAALGHEAVARIFKTIAVYDEFCNANDPYEERDFGALDVDGHTIFFKIDYYDPTLTCHSSDPADPTVTQRVITIMLAEEY